MNYWNEAFPQESARSYERAAALKSVPTGVRYKVYPPGLWYPHYGDTRVQAAALKILHRRAREWAAANSIPGPADVTSFDWYPCNITPAMSREVTRALVGPAWDMMYAYRRRRPAWRWPECLRQRVGYPEHPRWPDNIILPVSGRAFGWLVSHPVMLVLAARDYMWRAVVLTHLLRLSGFPDYPGDPQD